MPNTPSKPGRIKSILDYLQQDVPKVGDNEESVPGEDMSKVPPRKKKKKEDDDDLNVEQMIPMG